MRMIFLDVERGYVPVDRIIGVVDGAPHLSGCCIVTIEGAQINPVLNETAESFVKRLQGEEITCVIEEEPKGPTPQFIRVTSVEGDEVIISTRNIFTVVKNEDGCKMRLIPGSDARLLRTSFEEIASKLT